MWKVWGNEETEDFEEKNWFESTNFKKKKKKKVQISSSALVNTTLFSFSASHHYYHFSFLEMEISGFWSKTS